MRVEPQELELYQTDKGKTPFEDWLHSLKDQKARAIVRARIARVRLGNFGDSKPVGEGVQELRIDYGSGYRVYYARKNSRIVILLVGGDKKTQSKDIKKAIEYWNEYRGNENG